MFYTHNSKNIVNDFFNDLDKIFTSSGYQSSLYNNSGNYNTESDDSGVTLTMNVPGYNSKLIDVSVKGDSLVIEGKSNSGDTDGFNHKFTIGEKLDTEEIKATVVDGVLTVSVPYREEVKPRKIKVKVG